MIFECFLILYHIYHTKLSIGFYPGFNSISFRVKPYALQSNSSLSFQLENIKYKVIKNVVKMSIRFYSKGIHRYKNNIV